MGMRRRSGDTLRVGTVAEWIERDDPGGGGDDSSQVLPASPLQRYTTHRIAMPSATTSTTITAEGGFPNISVLRLRGEEGQAEVAEAQEQAGVAGEQEGENLRTDREYPAPYEVANPGESCLPTATERGVLALTSSVGL